VYEVFGSLREITSVHKVINSLSDGGLMNGSQILVNSPVKSGVTQLSVASLRYQSALQTTKAPHLSAGLITMSFRAWSD
jgi:hypothetical protein